MKSMTGFGYKEVQNEKMHLTIDLKSYNNRYLDIIVHIPPVFAALEPRLRDFISGRIHRGRIELQIRFRELEENVSLRYDEKTVSHYAETLRALQRAAGIQGDISLSHLLKIEGVLKPVKNRDVEMYWNQMLPLLEEVVNEFETSRIKEGVETEKDIISNIDVIAKYAARIEELAPEADAMIKSNLRERFEELLGDQVEENRILSEMAVVLAKHNINEEVIRMKAHIDSFKAIAASESSVGKKLDFICQELNREINTIGSKSTLLEVHQAVIEVKDAIEKIREQLRNVE